MFGKKAKQEVVEKPFNPVIFEGQNFIVIRGYDQETYREIDRLVGLGYRIVGCGGLDAGYVMLEKPKNVNNEATE